MGCLENLGSLRSRVVSMDYVLLKFPKFLKLPNAYRDTRKKVGIKK